MAIPALLPGDFIIQPNLQALEYLYLQKIDGHGQSRALLQLGEESHVSIVPLPSELKHSCLLEKSEACVGGNSRYQVLRKSFTQLWKAYKNVKRCSSNQYAEKRTFK